MDVKLKLLKEFYAGLPHDRAKIETEEFGFDFLAGLLSGGAVLDYGELTLTRLLHKYKLIQIPQRQIDDLLLAHIKKQCNVCLYFDDVANNLFCFNLDNNHKQNNTVIIPEMALAVASLREYLTGLGCEPLVIASGRGYHVWCRLAGKIENVRLFRFMIKAAAHVMEILANNNYDYNKIKFNFYPDIRIENLVSLRLFGSEHAKNKTFSSICTADGQLNEPQSWQYFEDYLKYKTIAETAFLRVCQDIF